MNYLNLNIFGDLTLPIGFALQITLTVEYYEQTITPEILCVGMTGTMEQSVTLRLDPHFGVAVKPHKQNMWFCFVWWWLLIGQRRQFPAWLKVWVKPQELCGINSDAGRR